LETLLVIMNEPAMPGPIQTICIGAASGAAVGWFFVSSSHSALAIALLGGCSIVAAYIGLIYQASEAMLSDLSAWAHRAGAWTRYGLALLLTACSLSLYLAHGHNPQDHSYVFILPGIVLSGALLGYGPGVLAVAAGLAGIDLISGAPVSHDSISNWQLIWPVLAFSGLGAILGFGFFILLVIE
jgi:hypothetical protein